MQKLIRLAVGFLLLAVVFVTSCGEETTSPTKAKEESDAVILGANHADTLNSGGFSTEIAQELAGQGVKLSEKSTILVRDEGKEWLITDTENELAYLVTNGGDKLDVQKTGFIDYLGEADQIVEFWETYRKLYNDRKITTLLSLWNKKASDHIYINISENEPISADGAEGVRNVLLKLSKGHHSTKGDNWKGSAMSEVYIKKRGSQLVASAEKYLLDLVLKIKFTQPIQHQVRKGRGCHRNLNQHHLAVTASIASAAFSNRSFRS